MGNESNDLGYSKVYWDRVRQTVVLKDYAISNNLDISDETLEDINDLLVDDVQENQYLLDRCIRDLTAVTYPTTIDTVSANFGGFSGNGSRFLWILAIIGIAMLFLAVFTFSILKNATASTPLTTSLAPSILAACLGVLGALIYIFFNLIGVMSEKAFSESDIYSNSLRLIIGAIIGWIFYFAFRSEIDYKNDIGGGYLLLPFLGGFSTRLVVGILTQAISAMELTLGLEDKSTDLRKRKVNEPKRKKC